MRLSIFERINLLSILPHEGTFATLKIIREMREKLSFSEAENTALNFQSKQSPDGQQLTTWNLAASVKIGEPDIKLSDFQVDICKKELEKLDKAGKLRDEHMTLFEKCCLNENEDPKK